MWWWGVGVWGEVSEDGDVCMWGGVGGGEEDRDV